MSKKYKLAWARRPLLLHIKKKIIIRETREKDKSSKQSMLRRKLYIAKLVF